MEFKVAPGDRSRTGNQTGQCTPLPPPPLGTLQLVTGNGTSVGTVMTLVCPGRHRPINGGRISCVQEGNSTQWIGGTPECKSFSFEEGFRLALLLSIISTTIILLMSIIFITSCLVKRVKKEEMRQLERKRKKENARLWHQLNAEEQRESFYNHNERINNNSNHNYNNNNNNNSSSSSSEQEQHPRCHQKNYPDPLTIHHLQPIMGQMPPHMPCV